MKNCRTAVAVFLFFLPISVLAQGTFEVRFDRNSYLVSPGGTFQVSSLINPVPADGLFSFGVQVLFEAGNVQVASDRAIVVPAPLDFNGPAGLGALRVIGADSAGAKGSVDPAILPPRGYTASALASFELTDLSLNPGKSYELKLGLFRTLGPTESVFVSGKGEQLDDRLVFGTALVQVIPEPSPAWLLVTAGLLAGWAQKPRMGLELPGLGCRPATSGWRRSARS